MCRGVAFSGGVSSSQPRKILHSSQCTPSLTCCWDVQGAQKTRAETRAPVTHLPPLRPTGHISHPHTLSPPPFTHVPASSSRSHTHTPRADGHSRQITRARSRPRRPNMQTGTLTSRRLPVPGSAAAAAPLRLSPQNRPDSLTSGFQVSSEVGASSQRKGPWET